MTPDKNKPTQKQFNTLVRRKVYDEYLSLEVSFLNLDSFCERKAQELGATASRVKAWILHYRDLDEITRSVATTTAHQKVATAAGASFAAAAKVLADQLKAKTTKVHFGPTGDLVYQEDFIDNAARIAAAEKVIKIHGGFAPDKTTLEVRDDRDPSQMTLEQIEEELAEYKRRNPTPPVTA